jgi:hypothetical protein
MKAKAATADRPLAWGRRARVWRQDEFETRTWTSLDGRWRVQECSVRLYGMRNKWFLVSVSVGEGWSPLSRHRNKAAAMAAADKHRRSGKW